MGRSWEKVDMSEGGNPGQTSKKGSEKGGSFMGLSFSPSRKAGGLAGKTSTQGRGRRRRRARGK